MLVRVEERGDRERKRESGFWLHNEKKNCV
jgi:hypothetical protein